MSMLQWPGRRPVATLLVMALLAALSIMRVRNLHVDVSLKGIISSDNEVAEALDRVLNHFSAAQEVLVLASMPEAAPVDVDRLLGFAKKLEEAIANDSFASKEIAAATYRLDALTRQIVEKVIAPAGMFYLSDAEFAEAKHRLTREGMAEQLHRDEELMAVPGPSAAALSKAIMQDPLRLHEFLLSRLAALRSMPGYGGSDAFLSLDGRSLLIRLTGTQSPNDLEFARQITSTVHRLTAQCNTDGLRIDVSGAYPVAARSAESIQQDTIVSIIILVIGMVLLFGIAFRKPLRMFLLAMAPVALGILFGFAVYSLILPTITPLTAVIGAMLAGIGIDYSIQHLSHYDNWRRAGRAAVEASEQTIRTIGMTLVAAWATSVVGFFAVSLSSIRILRDFAIAGALGLSCAFACTLVVLPAILAVGDRSSAASIADARFSLTPLMSRVKRHTRGLIGACCVSMLIAVALSVRNRSWMELDSDVTVLHPRPNPPLDAEQTIARRMGIAPGSLIVHLRADSDDQLVALAHDVQTRCLSESAVRDAGVSGVLGLATVLPDPRVAPRRVVETGPAMAQRVLADFDSVVAESSFNPQAFSGYRDFLRLLLTQTQPPDIEALKPFPQIDRTMLPRDRGAAGQSREAMTLVFVNNSLGSRTDRQRTLATLRSALGDLPGATLTGMTVIGQDIETSIRRDLPRLIGSAIAVVGLYLVAHFRSIHAALLALSPTIFSLLCLLGVMALLGQRLNLVNIVSIPLLIGIDVDYGIFMVGSARLARGDSAKLLALASVSARAIVLCAAATLLGFGSMYFTSIPAVQSLGMAVAVGVSGCAAASIFLLAPILFRKGGEKQ